EAGASLTRRAGLSAQVRLVPADAATLPFRAAHFTHVWLLEALPRLPDPRAALREAHRVLRRGGTVAIQDLVRPDAARAADIPGWMPATAAERVAALERLGFVEVALRDRTAEAPERSAQVLRLGERPPDELEPDWPPVACESAGQRERRQPGQVERTREPADRLEHAHLDVADPHLELVEERRRQHRGGRGEEIDAGERGAHLVVETGAQALRREVLLGGDELPELEVDAQLDAHPLPARGEQGRERATRLAQDE